jgi:hypothetical protein
MLTFFFILLRIILHKNIDISPLNFEKKQFKKQDVEFFPILLLLKNKMFLFFSILLLLTSYTQT